MRKLPPIGSTVRLINGRTDKTAKVIRHYSDVHGGVRLDEPLDGFKSWNMRDLELAPPQRGGSK